MYSSNESQNSTEYFRMSTAEIVYFSGTLEITVVHFFLIIADCFLGTCKIMVAHFFRHSLGYCGAFSGTREVKVVHF